MTQNILLIQDDPVVARVVLDALTNCADRSFKVEWVRRCAEGLERLTRQDRQAGNIAAVLVDLALPDCRGIDTFDRLFCAAPQIPILILSAAHDEETARLAVQRGAQDYLLKAHLDSYMLPKNLGSMIERAAIADALFEERERAQVTLNSIGDAVISTDVSGRVTYLNVVAERMTGWSLQEAAGQPIEEVLRIVDAASHAAVENPLRLAIREDTTVGLAANCILLRRDGAEAPIEDSAAPIHDRRGQVTGAVIVFHDVSAARALAIRMSHLAMHDGLTDLPNRMLLNDRLKEAIELANRHGRKVALLFLDIDHFKDINDSLGHAIGDRLLQSVAQRVLACVRSSDTVSRQGGDEFVILLPEVTHSQDAAVSAEKILATLRAPHRIDQHDLHVSASIGIVTYPDDGADAESLLKDADAAMYHAKDSGRDNYQFFRHSMNGGAIAHQSLETGLRHALERHEFVLHYQPQLNLQTGAIVGAEALLRWRHPQYGLMPPAQFIAIAEECGLIEPIGRWVLREVCHEARAWQDAGLPPLCIAANISPLELRAAGFVAGVRTILTESGLAPCYLQLELAESFLLQDSSSAAAILHALADMGVHLALNDFSTGYSSLSYLNRFPIDTLKIDRSFVHDLATDADDAAIICAVIGMGKSMQMRVVAEGVETFAQLAFLRAQRCHEGQGYYFNRPMSAGEFAQLLEGSEQLLPHLMAS